MVIIVILNLQHNLIHSGDKQDICSTAQHINGHFIIEVDYLQLML